MLKLSKRNPKYFAPIYDKYYNQIFRFALKRIGNESQTGDVVSQVFLIALVNLNKYQFKGHPFSSWLYRIAINEVNQHYRTENKLKEVSISGKELNIIAEEAGFENKNRVETLIEILNNLSDEEQQLIELRFFDKCSFKEMGEIYGVEEATIKIRVYRLLKRMKNNNV